MTDTQSGSQDPSSSDEPQNVDTEALSFLKSLFAVFRDHRNVLMPRLPERMEHCLNTEPLNPDLAESQYKEESREDDAYRLAERKRSDLERKLESMQFDIDIKDKRVTALNQTIKDKTAILETMKSEENASIATKDRKTVEKALKRKDNLLEESERKAQCLKEECLNLKKELEKREREIPEREKVQAEKCLNLEKELEKKEKEISETKKVQQERISAVKNESENKLKEMSDKAQQLHNQLLKERDDLQKMYSEYQKTFNELRSSQDGMINELAVKDKEIQEYMKSLSKMKEELRNANTKLDLYKSRLASVSEKRVKQDQRLVEDTLSLNRQSDLERDFSAFFDADRMDACDTMQSIFQNKEDSFVFIYYPRLACIIFETAYEQVKEAKEAAADLFKELIKIIIKFAPELGKGYSKARKEQFQSWTFPLTVNTWSDGTECPKDVIEGMILSLKEAARTCSPDYFVESVSTIAFRKWGKWCDEDKSCLFTPAWHLIQRLDKYIKACIRLSWRMVTQVPPMRLEFQSSRFNKDVHKKIGYHSEVAHQDQGDEIACYLWPGLQDGGGRLIRAGEVLCRFNEP